MNKDYFKCYNKKLSKFLLTKGIYYIVVAIEPKNGNMYSLYACNDDLSNAINEYKQLNK